VRLLDKIEDERGATSADKSLAILSRVFNWHAARSDDFRSPIVRGMRRTRPSERARTRKLTDDEMRAVWNASLRRGAAGGFVRFLLLTGCRRSEAARMTWDEAKEGIWTLAASRTKSKVEVKRPLSKAAQAVIAERPQVVGCPYIFSCDGKGPLAGYSTLKRGLDKASRITGWTLHDIRRTSRSLLSRCGVPTEIGEIILGHSIPGVRGVYDRHDYQDQMRDGLERLAAEIARIVKIKSGQSAFRIPSFRPVT
jgi:integrase